MRQNSRKCGKAPPLSSEVSESSLPNSEPTRPLFCIRLFPKGKMALPPFNSSNAHFPPPITPWYKTFIKVLLVQSLEAHLLPCLHELTPWKLSYLWVSPNSSRFPHESSAMTWHITLQGFESRFQLTIHFSVTSFSLGKKPSSQTVFPWFSVLNSKICKLYYKNLNPQQKTLNPIISAK